MGEKLFWGLVALGCAGLIWLGIAFVGELNDYTTKCEARGGRVVEMGDRYHCVKKEFFVQ